MAKTIQQLSVFLENKEGKSVCVLKILTSPIIFVI